MKSTFSYAAIVATVFMAACGAGRVLSAAEVRTVADHVKLTNYPMNRHIRMLDENMGKVHDALRTTDDVRNPGQKLIDNTLIVITSDHGEHLGSLETLRQQLAVANDPRHFPPTVNRYAATEVSNDTTMHAHLAGQPAPSLLPRV